MAGTRKRDLSLFVAVAISAAVYLAILLGPAREILWFNGTAGHWLQLRRKVDYGLRIDNLVRHPDFVEYLDQRGAMAPPRIHLPKQGDRWLLFRLVTTSDHGAHLLRHR